MPYAVISGNQVVATGFNTQSAARLFANREIGGGKVIHESAIRY